MHETTRNPTTTGKAAPTGNSVVEKRQNHVGSRQISECFQKFYKSLVSCAQNPWHQSPSSKADTRSTLPVVSTPEKEAGSMASERASGIRLFNRPLDIRAYSRTCKEKDWRFLSPQPLMETTWGHGMELSEAGTPGSAKERRGYCQLETVSLAPHKKKPKNLVPIWFFLTRAGFLLFPVLSGHGLPKERRLISIISTVRIKSLLLQLSVFLRKENELSFMPGSGHTTLPALMFGLFWDIFSSIFVTTSCSCGTGEPFIAAKKSSISWQNIREFMLNGFPHMLQNLIRLSMSGTMRIQLCQTVSHIILPNSGNDYGLIRQNFSSRKNFFGLVFMPLIYQNCNLVSFHYLCETQ